MSLRRGPFTKKSQLGQRIAGPFVAVVLASTALLPLAAAGAASGDGVPSVTGVEVTSDAGADATYVLGEVIRVTVTFS